MSTLASSFTYTGFSISAPVGTIVSYLGTSDPSGWIICDGVQRTGGAGRYKELFPILNAAMGVTSNTQDSVTPPNLREKFLYGKAASTGTSGTGGSSSVTITESNMPTHKHDVTASQAAHTHTANQDAHTHTVTSSITQRNSTDTGTETAGGFAQDVNTWEGGGAASGGYVGYKRNLSISVSLATADPDISVGSATPLITVTESNKGGGTALTLPVPPHFTVNYIIKY